MPPDISTGPMVAAGTPPGRASALTAAGPPGGDPLAALFAAFLVQSAGPSPTGAAATMPKTAPKPGTPAGANGKTTGDKTQDKTLSAALLTMPPLLTPIQMRPTLPPTAGVPVGQKTAGKKTMDTSPVSASPIKEKAGVTPGGELPLQDARMAISGASALFPAFLIASPAITPLTPPVGSPAGGLVPASPAVLGPSAAVPSLPIVQRLLPGTTPTASPGVFSLAAALQAKPPTGDAPQSGPASGPAAPTGVRPVAPSHPALAGYVPQPQGLAVPVDAVLKMMKLPAGDTAVGETVAADSPTVTPPVPAPTSAKGVRQALPNVVQVLVPTLPQAASAVAVHAATPGDAKQGLAPGGTAATPITAKASLIAPLTNELTVTDGKAAREGVWATDGKAATDGRIITEDKPATDGGGAMDGSTATDGKAAKEGGSATDGSVATDGTKATEGKTLTAGRAPEKSLKSGAAVADTLTRSQAVPAKTLPADLGLQVIGRRSGRSVESVGSDILPALPAPLPAQAEAARTEAKPLTAADRAEMVRQVADGVGTMPLPAKPGASEQMTLQLHPQDWGQLQISVRITPGSHPNAVQAVTAHIVAETPQVKTALENGSGDLRQALRAAGLHLDRISVTVQSTEASAQAGTATSGGRHEANHGGASQGMDGAFGASNQKTGMSSETRTSSETGMSGAAGNGLPSATTGGSHGGRQGGQPPPAYAAAYAPAETEDNSPVEATRRLARGQVDIRA